MCGIAGIFDSVNPPEMRELEPMVRILRHRGPDSDGFMLNPRIALGMRRLSIIDLKSGDQPISNAEGSITVILNGEIYNYLELRDNLLRKGYVFQTQSDTEVLVHLYAEHGTEMLPLLNGMFAFAIWDDIAKRLFLARDRMGVKPLYYARFGSRLLFASELKSLLTCSNLARTFDMDALADYLRLGYIPREATPFRSVRRLLPGHFLLAGPDFFRINQWWDLREVNGGNMHENTPGLRDELARIFDQSVCLRMRSDVSVASFLSGGLDSGLITATAAKLSPLKFQTFNVRFRDSLFDESPYADSIAAFCKTDHRQIEVTSEDALQKLPLLLWHMDEPMADSAIIPSFLVSRFAAQYVKVCLSGLGGDELFGGYSRYADKPMGKYRRYFSRHPLLASLLIPVLSHTVPRYAVRLQPLSGSSSSWRTYLNHIQLFDTFGLRRIGIQAKGTTEDLIEDLWNQYPGNDDIGRRQFIDQHTYLPDQILALTDRMSMAVSLEVRVPFMDPNMVLFAAALPGKEKQNGADNFKIFLKSALGSRVPGEILTRRKWGFAAPVEKWINSPILSKSIRFIPNNLGEVMNKRYLKRLIEDRRDPRYHNIIWSLLVLSVWLKVYGSTQPPDFSVKELLG